MVRTVESLPCLLIKGSALKIKCMYNTSLYCIDERFSVFQPSKSIQLQLQFKFISYQLLYTLNSTEKSIQQPIQNTLQKIHACNSHRLMAETPEKANR